MGNKKNKKNNKKQFIKTSKEKQSAIEGRRPWEKKVSIEKLSFAATPLDSTEKDKITVSSGLIKEIKSEEIVLDLVDIMALCHLIKMNTRCVKCKSGQCLKLYSTHRSGLASDFSLQCNNCGILGKTTNSTRREYQSEGKSFHLESINFALINAARLSGFGRTAAKRFLSFLNLRSPPDNWILHQTLLRDAFKKRAEESMSKATEEMKAYAKENQKDGLSASFDGSWMKRGRISMIGFVSAIGMYTNKVIGVDVQCKYCQTCKGMATEEQPCQLGAKCGVNHRGSSGAMEPKGAVNIIASLLKKGVKIAEYLGDGDSRAFALVKSHFNWIKKLECINHVAKRMGKRLLDRKKTVKGLGGKQGTLTNEACRKIQSYFHWIITSSDGDASRMSKRVDALYRHISSSDAKPDHGLCEAEYCKYASEKLERDLQKNKQTGKMKKKKTPMKYRHQNPHFHIPASQMEKVKDIFEDLAQQDLLSKVTHGKTQNSNECFNSTVWNLLPKNGFANRSLVELAIYMAICQFNEGRRPILEILSSLRVPIGDGMKKYCYRADELRVSKRKLDTSSKTRKQKKKKMAVEKKATAKDYSPGAH